MRDEVERLRKALWNVADACDRWARERDEPHYKEQAVVAEWIREQLGIAPRDATREGR